MEEEQKYLNELNELKLFSELYQKFYDKIKYTLSGSQEKAFEIIFYNTKKIYDNIIEGRVLSFNNSAKQFLDIKKSSLDISLKLELKELQNFINTPIKNMPSDWFYLFVIISNNLQKILTKKNKMQTANNLMSQRYCEYYVRKNQLGRINGGRKTSSIFDTQRRKAEQIFINFKKEHPELIEKFKANPKCNKPKTELKKMLKKDNECIQISERTLQNWSKQLLESDGILIKNTTTSC